VYATLFLLYIIGGILLNKLISGEGADILMEIPPYRRPDIRQLLKKTWIRVRFFITEATPYIMLGVLAVQLAYSTGAIPFLSEHLGQKMADIFGLPPEVVVNLIIGFVRKDFAVGMLSSIPMTAMQFTVAATLLVTFMPCLATLTVLYKELGLRDFIKAMLLMLSATVVVGVIMRIILL
jgi:ferrous iron transport protein B